jgi:hypothetical protein
MLMPGPDLTDERKLVEGFKAAFTRQLEQLPQAADFVAHLLDPAGRELVKKAMDASDGFRQLHDQPSDQKEAASRAVDEIIDFKVAEKGIETGQIKSIIHPTLADHVRREALKAADELARAT